MVRSQTTCSTCPPPDGPARHHGHDRLGRAADLDLQVEHVQATDPLARPPRRRRGSRRRPGCAGRRRSRTPRCPAPVKTITPTWSSSRARLNASDSSNSVCGRNALCTSGRQIVILAIPSGGLVADVAVRWSAGRSQVDRGVHVAVEVGHHGRASIAPRYRALPCRTWSPWPCRAGPPSSRAAAGLGSGRRRAPGRPPPARRRPAGAARGDGPGLARRRRRRAARWTAAGRSSRATRWSWPRAARPATPKGVVLTHDAVAASARPPAPGSASTPTATTGWPACRWPTSAACPS